MSAYVGSSKNLKHLKDPCQRKGGEEKKTLIKTNIAFVSLPRRVGSYVLQGLLEIKDTHRP